MDKKLIDFKFLHLKNDNFTGGKGDRLLNDILQIKYIDNSQEYRIYLNNIDKYICLTYNDNMPMINELSKYTWTLDNIGYKCTHFIKSEADDKIFADVIERYGLNKRCNLDVKNNDEYPIDNNAYIDKRKEFKKNYTRE